MKTMILESDEVKKAIAKVVEEKAKYYEGHLSAMPAENKIFGDV